MSTAQIARRFFVSGIVQGVGFRYFTQDEAERLQVNGFVRNLRDGRVEVYAIGSAEILAKLRTLIGRGPQGSRGPYVAAAAAEPRPPILQKVSPTVDHLRRSS